MTKCLESCAKFVSEMEKEWSAKARFILLLGPQPKSASACEINQVFCVPIWACLLQDN